MSTTTTADDERDPQAVCACGHHETEHAPELPGVRVRWPRRCQATQPDPCSCRGYRQGPRHRA